MIAEIIFGHFPLNLCCPAYVFQQSSASQHEIFHQRFHFCTCSFRCIVLPHIYVKFYPFDMCDFRTGQYYMDYYPHFKLIYSVPQINLVQSYRTLVPQTILYSITMGCDLTCSSPRRHLCSHSLICIKNHLFIVGIGPIRDKEL